MARTWLFAGKAISVCQPWAAAIAYLGKDIENRPMRTHFRGPVAIHASLKTWPEDLDLYRVLETGGPRRRLGDWLIRAQTRLGLEVDGDCRIDRGCVLAIGMLVDCVERSRSRWFGGEFGWVIQSVVPIEPVPLKGKLGLWDCRFRYRLLSR